MHPAFRSIAVEEIQGNTFEMIGKRWFLLTAGTPEDFNTMTAASGALGVHIGVNLAIALVRPQRHTWQFMERFDNFTLSFFDEAYRPALELCGKTSGRDTDKAAATGLTPIPCDLPNTTAFAEARLIIACRKAYTHDLDPARFITDTFAKMYPRKDYHRLYFGEIVECWARNE